MTVDLAGVLLRLADLGPPSEVRARAPQVAADVLGFDRVLLTSISDGELVPQGLHIPAGRDAEELLAALRAERVALDYPLIEVEIMRRRRAQVVPAAEAEAPGRRAYATVLGRTAYAVAPVMLEGRVIGFLHADRDAGGTVDDEDAARLAGFAVAFALVYERAVLRHRLRVQHEEIRQVASWADARTSDLGDRSVSLAEEGGDSNGAATHRPSEIAERALRDLLTRREIDVLELMVRGETNAGIARDLVVSEGTVKFHVKNILRKLHAANRAEATSRYLRLTLNRGGADG